MIGRTEFVDTSVFVAAFWSGHPNHPASLRLVSRANRGKSSCGVHTLAEVYATMTALPVRDVIPPDQALLFIQEIRERFKVITLNEGEYWDTITQASARGFTSGRIYDALLLRCARKANAKAVYTWNLRHFQTIDPEWSDRMRTP